MPPTLKLNEAIAANLPHNSECATAEDCIAARGMADYLKNERETDAHDV